MKQVTKIQTSDGKLHDTERAAKRHAENRYHLAIDRLAARAVRMEKITSMREFIENSVDDFAALTGLRDDIELDTSDDFVDPFPH